MPNRERVQRLAFGIAAALIVVVAVVLRGSSIGKPIEAGWHQYGIRQALAARNFLQHGLGETRGAMVLNGGPAEPDEFQVYTHHPPLLPLVLAGAFGVFGDTLTVYRLTLIAFSAVSIALLIGIVRSMLGGAAALAAGGVAAICPLAAFYATGGDVLGEGLSTFVLCGIACRLLSRKQGTATFILELGSYSLATLHDWPGLFAFAIPLVDALVTDRTRRGIMRGLLALGAATLIFALLYAWAHVFVPARLPQAPIGTTGDPRYWSVLMLMAEIRDYPDLVRAKLSEFVYEQRRAWSLPILATAALGALAILVRAIVRRPAGRAGRLLILLLVPGLAFALILPRMFLLHTYAAIVLVPSVAVAAGWLAGAAWRLGLAGKAAVVGWAVLCGYVGVDTTRDLFAAHTAGGLHHVGREAAALTRPDDLVVTYDPLPWPLAFHAGRNVVARVTTLEPPAAVALYQMRHPGTSIVYVLPPPMKTWPAGVPDQARLEEERRYATMERELESRFERKTVEGYRLYRIS